MGWSDDIFGRQSLLLVGGGRMPCYSIPCIVVDFSVRVAPIKGCVRSIATTEDISQ
jgi:hypothetical protein